MAEYITKEAVYTMVRHLTRFVWIPAACDQRRTTVDIDDVHFGIDKIPAADVAPAVHGRWKPLTDSELTGWPRLLGGTIRL